LPLTSTVFAARTGAQKFWPFLGIGLDGILIFVAGVQRSGHQLHSRAYSSSSRNPHCRRIPSPGAPSAANERTSQKRYAAVQPRQVTHDSCCNGSLHGSASAMFALGIMSSTDRRNRKIFPNPTAHSKAPSNRSRGIDATQQHTLIANVAVAHIQQRSPAFLTSGVLGARVACVCTAISTPRSPLLLSKSRKTWPVHPGFAENAVDPRSTDPWSPG